MCIFFRQNGGEGFFKEEGNLIPLVFTSLCGLVGKKAIEVKLFLKKLGVDTFKRVSNTKCSNGPYIPLSSLGLGGKLEFGRVYRAGNLFPRRKISI
jgi:hypothetical protein